jgi:leader peptidase (prepilin peptidase)/N-methyltransferase
MFAWFLTIPLEARLAAIFVAGLALGALVNLGIYSLAWNTRAISPWSRTSANAPPRRWFDYVPLVGWLTLRRETKLWGRGFWVRPLLIELATAAGLALLYYWEVTGQLVALPATPDALHQRFVSHGFLILLLIVATFIDFDEKTIPDSITVPGTLIGLLLAFLWPYSLPTHVSAVAAGFSQDSLWLTSPGAWSARLNGWEGLAFGLFCFLGWCFGILEKRWTLRRGWKKAVIYFFASIGRYRTWPFVLAITVVGAPLIIAAWWFDGLNWQALLSSLAGMAFGGGLVWAIRIIGSQSLGREAMGFGDVTLMAMIGAFVGWQGALIAFFIAPFTALFIAIAQWLFTGRRELAFGPYLCAGALYVLLRWPAIWGAPFAGLQANFMLGWFIPAIVVVCLGLMWLMLIGLRWLREFFERS